MAQTRRAQVSGTAWSRATAKAALAPKTTATIRASVTVAGIPTAPVPLTTSTRSGCLVLVGLGHRGEHRFWLLRADDHNGAAVGEVPEAWSRRATDQTRSVAAAAVDRFAKASQLGLELLEGPPFSVVPVARIRRTAPVSVPTQALLPDVSDRGRDQIWTVRG
jgi:hypothetical protein